MGIEYGSCSCSSVLSKSPYGDIVAASRERFWAAGGLLRGHLSWLGESISRHYGATWSCNGDIAGACPHCSVQANSGLDFKCTVPSVNLFPQAQSAQPLPISSLFHSLPAPTVPCYARLTFSRGLPASVTASSTAAMCFMPALQYLSQWNTSPAGVSVA